MPIAGSPLAAGEGAPAEAAGEAEAAPLPDAVFVIDGPLAQEAVTTRREVARAGSKKRVVSGRVMRGG